MAHRIGAVNHTTLYINNTEMNDEGLYRCAIINNAQEETIHYIVHVFNTTSSFSTTTEDMTTSSSGIGVTSAQDDMVAHQNNPMWFHGRLLNGTPSITTLVRCCI